MTAARAARLTAWLAALALACRGSERERQVLANLTLPPTPAEHREGDSLFAASCASCHGQSARGTTQGPPLLHIIYEPSHHSDAAFLLATQRGVAAHHWRFGDMPPQPDLDSTTVRKITAYVRWAQREVGID
jgi:cytochrome c